MSDGAQHPRPAGRPRLRTGFTLVELMIVVICVAVAGMLVVPQFSDQSPTKLVGAARLLAADLEYAQAESLANGDDPRQVIFDPANASYSIAPRSSPDTPIVNPIGREPYRTRFGAGRAATLDGVGIASVSLAGDDVLQFGVHGELDQVTAAKITLSCGTAKVDVTVHPITGETSVSELYR